MAFHPFTKIRVGDDEGITAKHVNVVQDNVSSALAQVLGKDVLDRRVLLNVPVTPSGINYVAHGLGRRVVAVSICLPSSDVRAWIASGTNLIPDRTLQIMASATGTLNLEVF